MSRKNKIKKNKTKKIKNNKTKSGIWNSMVTKIEGFGFSYSFADFAKTTILFLCVMVVVGYFLKLNAYFTGIFVTICLCIIPFMIISQFKYIYEQRRFNEITVYMEQMAYSFKKKPKILTALKDTAEITSGHMNTLVNNAIEMIENDYSDTIYKDAFAKIEKEYECSRILQLHKFLTKVEEQGAGAEYINSLDILIDDIASWTQRTFLFQKERADIRNKILLSLIISLGICSTTVFMIPEQMDITGNIVYQVATTITLVLFILIYTFTQTKLNGSWLENDAVKDEKLIRRDYKIAHTAITENDMKKAKKKVILVSPLLIISIISLSFPAIAGTGLVMFLLYKMPQTKYKAAYKRTMREIEKEIPGWCREIALNLQTENVYLSIANTVNTCPIVLEEAVKQLIEEIDENPGSVVPYNNFLSEFSIPEIGRMMKTLYSLSEYGVQDAEGQINKIIVQNNAMLEKAEVLKNEDSIALVRFITLLPMLLGSIKMIIDLFLLCTAFIGIGDGIL